MELERSSPSVAAQVYSDMDVDMCVYDYSGGGHRVQHPDEEFTLGMDIPVKLRVHVPSPTRGRKPPPPPPLSEVDELLFGHNISMQDLHPGARELLGPIFDQVEGVNKVSSVLTYPHAEH